MGLYLFHTIKFASAHSSVFIKTTSRLCTQKTFYTNNFSLVHMNFLSFFTILYEHYIMSLAHTQKIENIIIRIG